MKLFEDSLRGSEIYVLGKKFIIDDFISNQYGSELHLIDEDGKEIKLIDDRDLYIDNEGYITGLETAIAVDENNKLDRIVIYWEVADDLFITEDNKVVMPYFDNVQFRMEDFIEGATEDESYAKIYFEYII